jgi:hypothetical protein
MATTGVDDYRIGATLGLKDPNDQEALASAIRRIEKLLKALSERVSALE